jgi:hypothetical protein
MEKDFLTPDLTETMDEAITNAQNITPSDDPQLDPILPSQMTKTQREPNKRTMTMDEALRTYRLRLDSVETMNKIANGDIKTHFWGNAAKGIGDFVQEMKLTPAKFNGAIYRAFNGHIWPDMTEDEAVRLMDSTTSYVANQERLRNIIIQSEGGADSVGRNLGSGAAQVLSYGIVGLMTGGVGIGALAGIQEATEISQEFAEKAMEENEGTLRGYDNRKDAVYAALHGIISGYIETKLGVENLFTNSVKKQGIVNLGSQMLKSAVGEGAEEYLQEASKYLFENMADKNSRTFGEFQKDALTNAVYGAILGGTFGGLMYYPNKLRVEKALKAQGFTDVQAAEMADDMIGSAKNSILQEVDTRSQLRDHYGEQWSNLQTKIVTALENAGWKETHPEIDLQKYAADNADDIVRPLFNMSNKFGIDTRDLLQLSDINVIDNAIYLKPMNLGSPEVIANRIREKREQVKRLTVLARTGAGNPQAKQDLNNQIELLQKVYEQQTGNRLEATRRTRAAKARQDAEILANTAPSVSETIASIDVSQMATGKTTAQIRQQMDGQPFVYVGDKQLPVEYKVVPMDEVIASHIGQEINTKYSIKELQNRAQRGSRTDVSILQSRAARIQPENLGISYNTQNGAPVVNEKGEVIAGNGRYEVLRMTDEKGRARYNKYLESLGLDLNGIKDPILVRVLHNLTPEQQIAVADASNVSATSAFDNASQAVQDAKLLKGTTDVTGFLNKIPIESRQGLFLANDRVNKVALDRRYNDAMMAWLLNNDTALYEELYLMGGISAKVQTALNQVIPSLMALENQYPDVGIRADLANALKRLPKVARTQDFAFTISQAEIDDANTNLFNENALLYAFVFGKNTKTWEGTGADRLQVGLTLSEFFDAYTQMAVQNQENIGKTDLFGQPLDVERTSGDILAETLTKAFPREFEEGVAKTRDMKAVFLTRAQTQPGPTQLSQIDLMDTIQPSLFGDTSTASAVNNLPWEKPVNISNPIFFNRMPDATDIEVAKRNGYDSFLLMDKTETPTKLVLLDGSVVNLQKGAKIPSGAELYKPKQLLQTETSNKSTINTQDIYYQKVNGFYDPELEVIVLGRGSNTGTLPHEMAHFWANTIFNMVKSGKYNNNVDFMAQAMGMFKMLGVGMNQDSLTRDQQEMFASMTESVIFGMAPVPQGTELPMTAFLNWVPEKYKSILDIGYRNSDGRIVNPILDKQAVDWFNAWYANGTLPAIEMSPLQAENTNDEQDGRTIPSSAEVMKVRATEMTAESNNLRLARNEQTKEAEESMPISERAAANGASVMIESQPGNIELSTPPTEKKKGIVSYLIPGRGTNTREGMFAAARDYIKNNHEHAEEVAFGHPNEVMNDTGVDRAILIRALMEEYDKNDSKYSDLYHNLAETVSLAGKTPGLSNDMNFQFYLSAVRQITDGMEGIAAIKYAGTRNLDKARRTFNSDIDAFIQENANKILSASAENKEILVKKMFAEAAVKFKGDESMFLNQEELHRVRSLKTKEAFIDWANREIRKMLKATPDSTMMNKIMLESEKAQKAVKYLDSEDYAELAGGGKAIREWQMAVKDEQVPETWYSKIIGSWYPKAMLYNINTHTVNIGGNLINYGIVKSAVAAQYKAGNKVPESVMKKEKERLRYLYNSSLISVAGMRNPTSPTLLHGEQYNPREGKSTIGKIADFSMDLLGKEDNWFRTMAYVDALGYIATADAKKTGQSPTDLFREYKKLNQQKGTRAYEARQEALNIADIAVFQQNGTLARNLKKVRDALNFGRGASLGTLLGPFVKTPANIVEMGARAIAAPVTSTYHAVKGDWSMQDTISTGYFALACILTMGMMADYEPPYEAPKKYDPNKPYDSVRIRGTNMWIKLDTFAAASIPMRIIASIATGKGLGLSGSMNEVPLLGEIADTWQQTSGIEKDPYKQGIRFGANVAYNRVNTMVPAVLKYTLAAMHPADLDLEQIETGLPKTGIGRKIGRQYGLDGGETTTNDILRIFFNRLKITEE